MIKSSYMLIGQFRGGKHEDLGLSLFRANSDGTVTHLQTVRRDIAAGGLYMDTDRKLVYAVDARSSMDGRLGGGACVYTFRFEPETESLTECGCIRTLSAMPSYVTGDRAHKHLAVAHNGSCGRVTKLVKQADGGYRTETVFDDAAVVVLSLDAGGIPADICDLYIAHNEGEFGPRAIINERPGGPSGILANPGTAAHLHCAVLSPDDRVLVCCDFGQGKLHSFRFDGGKLIHADEWEEAVDCGLRYAAFHPTLPLVYVNCENRPLIYIYSYDPESGKLHREGECAIPAEEDGTGCRDILIDSAGSRLYLTANSNAIYVMEVLPEGGILPGCRIPCLGKSPRALAVSPDGNYLYCGCNRSDTVEVYRIDKNGIPVEGRIVAEGVSASAILLFTI